jgi:hypothetical protein
MTALRSGIARPAPSQGLQLTESKLKVPEAHVPLRVLLAKVLHPPHEPSSPRSTCSRFVPASSHFQLLLQSPIQHTSIGAGLTRAARTEAVPILEADGQGMAETGSGPPEHPLVYVSFYKFASLPDYEELRLRIQEKCDEQVNSCSGATGLVCGACCKASWKVPLLSERPQDILACLPNT